MSEHEMVNGQYVVDAVAASVVDIYVRAFTQLADDLESKHWDADMAARYIRTLAKGMADLDNRHRMAWL